MTSDSVPVKAKTADAAGQEGSFLSLNDIKPGDGCVVRSLQNYGAVRQRLLDMGIVPKTTIKVVRNAPLKDPIEIQVGDAFIAVRRVEAVCVEVENV